MTMFIDFRPVASASDTALDRRHPVYTVEGYARRGNEWVGWNACGTGGKGEEERGRVGERVEEIYDRPRACSRGRASPSRSFVSRSRDGLFRVIWKTVRNDPLPPLPSPSRNLRSRVSPRASIHFFASPLNPKCKRRRPHNLRHLHLGRNDFILFLVSRFSALCLTSVATRGCEM